MAFASLLATDGTAIHLFAPSAACVLCNFGIADSNCFGSIASFWPRWTTSGLPPETDILRAGRHVSKVPKPEAGVSAGHFYQPNQFRMTTAVPKVTKANKATTSQSRFESRFIYFRL